MWGVSLARGAAVVLLTVGAVGLAVPQASARNVEYGTDGPDHPVGTNGPDEIHALAGNDDVTASR